jgi:hypothetical protein
LTVSLPEAVEKNSMNKMMRYMYLMTKKISLKTIENPCLSLILFLKKIVIYSTVSDLNAISKQETDMKSWMSTNR